MKTLDQLEARTPVGAAHTPGDGNNDFIIDQPGSYYLTGNIYAIKTNAIHITAAGVTVDLNGFQIARRTVGSGSGIGMDTAASNCTIKNGSISGFSGGGVLASSRGGIISHVIVSQCSAGISLGVGDGWRIEGCSVHDNALAGIQTGSGCTLSYCSAVNNAGRGIDIGDGSTAHDCSALNNQGAAGISTGNGCTLTHCTARGNTSIFNNSAGISTGNGCTITACTAQENTSTNATLTGATGAGITAASDSNVQSCSALHNKGDGVRAGSGCSIIANVCGNNGGGDGAGVHVTGVASRIEGNHVAGNKRGINVDLAGNLIIKNSARGNTTNYDIAANNAVGPTVNAPASLAIKGNTGGSGVGSTDPWANISWDY